MAPKVHLRPRHDKKPVETAQVQTPAIQVVESVPVPASVDEQLTTEDNTNPADAPDTTVHTPPVTAQGADDEDEEDDEDVDLSLLQPDAPVGKAGASDEGEAQDEMGFLQIHSAKCLSCKALIPTMKKEEKACHWRKGNENCPAQVTKIVIRIPLEHIVPKFLTAISEGDYERLAKLSAVLAAKPDWYQQRVRDALAEAQRKAK